MSGSDRGKSNKGKAMRRIKLNNGFALIELMVVIGVLAILASGSNAGYVTFIGQARQSRAQTEFAVIRRQIESVHVT